MYALNLDVSGRVLSATYPRYTPTDAVTVDSLAEGDISDYLYTGGKYTYSPLPKPGNTVTAPRNIAAGDYITVNGVLYKATTNIPNGGAIITGQNAEETTVEAQLYELAQKGE